MPGSKLWHNRLEDTSSDHPWEAPGLSPEERDRRFTAWTLQRLDELLDDLDREELLRVAPGGHEYDALSQDISRNVARGRKIVAAKPAIDRMFAATDKAAFVRLTRDEDIAWHIAERLLFPSSGRKKNEPRKKQLFLSTEDKGLFEFVAVEEKLVHQIWKQHNVRRRDRNFPSADEIVVGRLCSQAVMLTKTDEQPSSPEAIAFAEAIAKASPPDIEWLRYDDYEAVLRAYRNYKSNRARDNRKI